MNFLVISPVYPANFRQFSIELAKKGVKVLGIGDTEYDEMPDELKHSLTEYFKVGNLEEKEEVLRAVAFLFYKHGRIDRVESHNEHWLELDAAIREQFHIPGMDEKTLAKTKRKSEMKKQFIKAGVPVVPGQLVKTAKDVKKAVKKLGLPLIAKPDKGVGSYQTYKLETEEEVLRFEEGFEGREYFFEPFVDGDIVTYDGLLDGEGNPVFETGMRYNTPPLALHEKKADIQYTVMKDLDPKLREMGRAILKQFGMKERFFHIEFFVRRDGSYLAIEYNNRPPGSYAVDKYNYAYSRNLYEDYARVVLGEEVFSERDDDSYCIALTRRNSVSYQHTEEELYRDYGSVIVARLENPLVFQDLQGDLTFVLKGDRELVEHAREAFARRV